MMQFYAFTSGTPVCQYESGHFPEQSSLFCQHENGYSPEQSDCRRMRRRNAQAAQPIRACGLFGGLRPKVIRFRQAKPE